MMHRAAALSALPAPRAAAAPRAALRRAPRASGPIGPADRAGLAERAAALSSHALGAAAALVLAAAPASAMGPLSGMGMGGMNMDMDDGMAPTASSPKEPKKPHTSAEWQTWAFSTAAPSYIAESATVIGVSEEGEANSVLREGSNGWTCLAGNPRPYPEGKGWASAHDAMPLCADEEGMKWITGYVNGEAPKMERDSIMYMLHGDMGEDNTKPMVLTKADAEDPSQYIESGSHLMLMPKDPKSLEKFPTDPYSGSPYQMFPGTPYVHLMIPAGDGYFKFSDK